MDTNTLMQLLDEIATLEAITNTLNDPRTKTLLLSKIINLKSDLETLLSAEID